MSDTAFQLDSSLENVLAGEGLDGKHTFMQTLHDETVAKLILSERHHSQTPHRAGTAILGDMEMREEFRMSAAGFHALYQMHGKDEMDGGDLLESKARHNPEMRVHYSPRSSCVFFPAAQTHLIIQASKYSPARA